MRCVEETGLSFVRVRFLACGFTHLIGMRGHSYIGIVLPP